ncbi:alpha/beta fold hydrolase [Actinophytocola sp.]|uniref:alpha/beta fold hydrolase n=1 Tax=Actinophytocola sp. TaxID=1872138 RepID=UPI0039C8B65F
MFRRAGTANRKAVLILDKLTSADGTEIAYERVGSGPTVVLVGGAFCDHTATAGLADALARDLLRPARPG